MISNIEEKCVQFKSLVFDKKNPMVLLDKLHKAGFTDMEIFTYPKYRLTTFAKSGKNIKVSFMENNIIRNQKIIGQSATLSLMTKDYRHIMLSEQKVMY